MDEHQREIVKHTRRNSVLLLLIVLILAVMLGLALRDRFTSPPPGASPTAASPAPTGELALYPARPLPRGKDAKLIPPKEFGPSQDPNVSIEVDQSFDATQTGQLRALAESDAPPYIEVKGTVREAQTSDTGKVFKIFFEGAPRNTGFNAIYFPRLYGLMAEKFGGENGSGLTGKTILVRGTPEMYRGAPEITIEDPGQVQVLEE